MTKYYLLIAIYLFSVASSSIANLIGIDVQNLYRIPFIGIRWIDLAILFIVGNYFSDLINNLNLLRKNALIISLCLLYLVYEVFQLAKSWQTIETGWQVSWFICTLNFFILLDFSTFKKNTTEIIRLLETFALWGAMVVIITNLYLVYSFISGNAVFTDLDIRVAIDVVGAKETVSTVVLIPLIYLFGLYFISNETMLWKKIVYALSILSIYSSLVIAFHRGSLVTITFLTLIYVFVFSKEMQEAYSKVLTIVVLSCVCYFFFGSILSQKGYDPVEKLSETVQFAFDTDNPDWDKGRSIPREYALNAWEQHPWTGVGYNNLENYGLPENISTAHNFIITSLFHRGIVGTGIYLLILAYLFKDSIKLWSLLNKQHNFENNIIKSLIIVSFFWLIPFWTQEVIWEKYSLSIEFMYLGIITNIYRQRTEK